MCHSNNINTFGAKLTEAEGYSLRYSEKQAPSENAQEADVGVLGIRRYTWEGGLAQRATLFHSN